MKFFIGAKVSKPKGYQYDGVVRSVFTTGAGEIRLVVESDHSKGMLHIFNENQLELQKGVEHEVRPMQLGPTPQD